MGSLSASSLSNMSAKLEYFSGSFTGSTLDLSQKSLETISINVVPATHLPSLSVLPFHSNRNVLVDSVLQMAQISVLLTITISDMLWSVL